MKFHYRSRFWTMENAFFWTTGTYFFAMAVLYITISANQACMLFSLDGTAWLNAFDVQEIAREPYTQLGVDPLQGSFDAYFPAFREYFLPNALSMVFTGSGANRLMTYVVYGALMIFATYVLARAVGFSRSVGLLAGIMLAAAALPTGPSWINPTGISWVNGLYSLNPHFSQSVALATIIIACFWGNEGKSLVVTIGLGSLAVALVMLSVASNVPAAVLMVPTIALYGGGSLIAGPTWRSNVPRLVTAAACVLVPALLGMVGYAKAVAGYAVYDFFGSELITVTHTDWYFTSILYHHGSLGPVVIVLGMLGACYAACTGPQRVRSFAWVHIIGTCAFQAIALLIFAYGDRYRGPSPTYFEFMVWPVMFIFSALILAVLVWHVGSLLSSRLNSALRGELMIYPFLLVMLAVVLASGNTPAAHARRSTICHGLFPIHPTPITERLQQDIALKPGTPFRGLVATFDGSQDTQSTDWFRLLQYDYMLWQKLGNDHRTVGLWWYRIPTLFQYSPLMTPPYYLLLTDFLARSADKQTRNVLVLNQPNEHMLKLWGVRYIITDRETNFGTPAVVIAVSETQDLSLIELTDTNLGTYSPTEVRRIDDFREGLRIMHQAAFDGRSTVVTDDEVGGPLVRAHGAKLLFEKTGFSVQASSTGRSLLVLPIQFSRCWVVSGEGNPKLLRANLMQLGISFEGRLAANLVFRFGPLLASQCRIDDIRDVERLRIRDARRSNSESSVVEQP